MSNIRVVFSIDLTKTFIFGVMGELASFRGLKLRTMLRILLEVAGLLRIRIESVFKVASTTRASLRVALLVLTFPWHSQNSAIFPYLLLSCRIPSILSRRAVASASSFGGSRTGWFGGIIASDISSTSPRCSYC